MGNNKRQINGIVTMLRACTILLAAVSFWATAQGMVEYTFPKSWQAYAASLGVQGLLLGLNFALPQFWKASKNGWEKFSLACLTLVLLACSSWFSYLYIAGQAYGKSWDIECRLLAQGIYRDELFNADTYTEQYGTVLENELTDQIVTLYNQASQMEQNAVTVNQQIDWEEERASANESAARDLLNTAIEETSSAISDSAPQNVREQASSALIGIQGSLQNELERINTRLQQADSAVATADANLQSARRNLTNAPDGADTESLLNAVNNASRTYENAIFRQSELLQQRDDYQEADQKVSYYMLILGMTEDGVNTYFVGTNLRKIQKELFQANPDSEQMMDLATEIFDRLQSGVDLGANDDTDSAYQGFLSSMNRFIQNLESYRSIKKTNSELKDTIRQLSGGEILALGVEPSPMPPDSGAESSNAPTVESSAEPTMDPTSEPIDRNNAQENEPVVGGTNPTDVLDENQPSSAPSEGDLEPSPTSNAGTGDDLPEEINISSEEWKQEWVGEFNDLKASISGLPVYTLTNDDSNMNALAELRAYNKAASTRNLDNAIRRYLTDHNAAQEGIIYLASPYRAIAIFSLIVALLLDISAFITGVIIDRVSAKVKGNEQLGENDDLVVMAPSSSRNDWWTIYPGLNRYVFLTGDYMCLDDIITYKTIENGKDGDIEYSVPNLDSGFYIWQNGKLVPVSKSTTLLFRGVNGGPKDGTYRECSVNYDQGLLMITTENISKFIGNVAANVPVYHFASGFYDVLPAEKLSGEKGHIAVVALNQEGTQIIAVYIISENTTPIKSN